MEALQRCGVVKNRKRRFRFTANLTNRSKADAMRKMNQEKLRVSPGLQFIQGHDGKKLTVHGGVEGVANTVATSTTNGISKTDGELKHRQEIYGINRFTKAQQAWKAWKPYFPLPLPLCLSILSSLSLSLSIPLIVPLPFAPSISLLSLDLSRLISRLFSTAQQDTSSSSSASPASSSPASLQCYPSLSQEPFVPLQHPHHLSTAKPNHMRPSLMIAPTATEVELGYKLKNLSSGCGDRKLMMESNLQNNFGDVKSKNSSEEALQPSWKRWRVVKNWKRSGRFTANLTKRSEAEAMRKTNQEKLRVSPGLQFIQGEDLDTTAQEITEVEEETSQQLAKWATEDVF